MAARTALGVAHSGSGPGPGSRPGADPGPDPGTTCTTTGATAAATTSSATATATAAATTATATAATAGQCRCRDRDAQSRDEAAPRNRLRFHGVSFLCFHGLQAALRRRLRNESTAGSGDPMPRIEPRRSRRADPLQAAA